MDQPGKVANPCSWSAQQGKLIFTCPRSRLIIWSREAGSTVPSRVSLLISILRLTLVLTSGIHPEFRGGVHLLIYLNHNTPSGQSRVYRVTTQLRTDGVHCRESADTGPVVLKGVAVTGAAFAPPCSMDRVMCSSLFSHPLLVQYEMGMMKRGG